MQKEIVKLVIEWTGVTTVDYALIDWKVHHAHWLYTVLMGKFCLDKRLLHL